MKIKLFLLIIIFLASPAMAQQGSITLYDNLCKSCHQNKEELFTKDRIVSLLLCIIKSNIIYIYK